jgi:RNA polymerase sigma-70 factor, ECF subfamily
MRLPLAAAALLAPVFAGAASVEIQAPAIIAAPQAPLAGGAALPALAQPLAALPGTGALIELKPAAQSPFEQALVERVKSGDPAAFGQLAELHQALFKNTAMKIVRNEQDAEDAVQNALLKGYRGIASFRGDAKFSTWMTRITVNEAISIGRRTSRANARFQAIPESEDGKQMEFKDERPKAEELLEFSELDRRIAAAVETLPPLLKEALILADYQELTEKEATARLGVNPQTFRSRVFRARAKLRDLLADDRPGGKR